MLNDFTGADQVYIACGYTDLRKGIAVSYTHLDVYKRQPFALGGFFQYNGMTLERFLLAYIRSEFLFPRRLVFKSDKDVYKRQEIHHIGNNINQIARSVNAGIAKPEDAKRGLYLLDQVYELMFRMANK